MPRILVQVQELPPREGYGRIELTWRDSRIAQFDVEMTTGTHRHSGIEEFTETEIVHYRTVQDREALIRMYQPMQFD